MDLLTIITSVGTLIAALAALYTVLEMKEQRLQAQKPDIIFENSRFLINSSHMSIIDPIRFLNNDIIIGSTNVLYFRIKNIGIGAAKKITIFSEFDITKFISLIKELDKNNLLEIVEKEQECRLCINYNQKKLLDQYFRLDDRNKLCNETEYLLPYSLYKEDVVLPVDHYYCHLYKVFFLLSNFFYNDNEYVSSVYRLRNSLPKIEYRIKYTDQEEIPYFKYFEGEIISFPSNEYFSLVQDYDEKEVLEVMIKEEKNLASGNLKFKQKTSKIEPLSMV